MTNIVPVEKMNLFQKLSCVRRMVDVLKKSKKSFTGNYAPNSEILARVKAGMDKYHLFLFVETVQGTFRAEPFSYVKVKFLKNGERVEEPANDFIVTGDILLTWVNEDNPDEKMAANWPVIGKQADPSQAFGSAFSYCMRYFFINFFQIATVDDDPEIWLDKRHQAELDSNKEATAAIIEEINTVCSNYFEQLGSGPDLDHAKKELLELVEKYARDKSGKATKNYKNIVEPENAAKVLNAITTYIGGKKNAESH